MDKIVKKANQKKCEQIIKALEKRSMTGHYCETAREAGEQILSMIKDGDTVSWGGSVTVDQLGIKERLPMVGAKSIDVWAPSDPEEARTAKLHALGADVYLTSTNAITMDGQLVNVDGTGNRIAAMAFGPRKVVVVAGVNKIAADVDSAVKRMKTDACPPNCIRLNKKTPCALTGKCADCLIPAETACCSTVITRMSNRAGRMHIILVNEELGY
ncbi:MAG: lactate utilization protein [Eubacteriaceae bacterium]|nr:lactate utilization protein [Eubacteriaceae bacterium]